MKTIYLLIVCSILTLANVSCSSKSKAEAERLKSETDSLFTANSYLQSMLDNMTGTVADISMSLDTIANLENTIKLGVDEEGNRLSRKSIKEKLQSLSELIAEQRAKMDSIAAIDNKQIAHLKQIIVFLDESLQKKDVEINQLKMEIDKKNFDISQLSKHVTNLQDTVEAVSTVNAQQKQQLTAQESAMNEVYYIIGTKDNLVKSGIISKKGKLIKKKVINFSDIDKSFLIKADRRTLTVIDINGKSPKIIGEVPEESYVLHEHGTYSTLVIKDVDKFWSANNKILVIQIK